MIFSEVCSVWNQLKNLWETDIATLPEMEKLRFIGVTMRTVFHDAGEFHKGKPDRFGADGCLAPVEDNFGLFEDETPLFTIIEKWWQAIGCQVMSRADFWTLVGNLVLRKTINFGFTINPIFAWGRKDNRECTYEGHRLPSAQGGINDVIKPVFIDQMGLTLHDAGLFSFFSVIRNHHVYAHNLIFLFFFIFLLIYISGNNWNSHSWTGSS